MESLIKAILDGGPPFYLSAASLLLNVVLMTFLAKVWNMHLSTIERFAGALALSTRANEASSESQDEMIQSAQENHHVQMLILGKVESVLANIERTLTKLESLITITRAREA